MRLRISKFIQSRQVISDEGLPELDIICWDWLNLIFVIAAFNNFFIIPKKQIPFVQSLNKKTYKMDCF